MKRRPHAHRVSSPYATATETLVMAAYVLAIVALILTTGGTTR